MELEGKIAIVSGGGQGIGSAISRSMAEEGARVIIAEIDSETAKSATDSIRKQTGEEFICAASTL